MIPAELIRKIRRLEIRTRRLVQEVFAGQYHSVFKGRGMEFDEVREYQPGDDVRAIDWNVTARMGHPYVKKFVEERELTVLLMADISASHCFGSAQRLKQDLVAELTAVLAFAAVRNQDRVGLLLFGDGVETYVPPRKGTTHALRLVRETLSRTPQRPGTRLAPALDFLNRVQPRRAVCFLIGDFLDDLPDDRSLALTARRHDLIALRVSDPREVAFPRAGVVRWRDLETGALRLLDTSDERVRRAYTARQLARREEWARRFRRLGVDLIDVATNQPYDKALYTFFKQRERRLAS